MLKNNIKKALMLWHKLRKVIKGIHKSTYYTISFSRVQAQQDTYLNSFLMCPAREPEGI